ncbi:MAG: c-type cytochrome [Bacteroidales bacterium]|nr:c-type cytochrome [Bacteroidales bacterium]
MVSLLFVAALFVAMTNAFQEPAEPWEVPAKYKSMENPEADSDESVKIGRMIYNKNCASCHGKTGLGDGSMARGLDTHPGDMSASAYQSQADGEHFYKTKFGRGEMPKYENKIDDEDIWNMINFMRTFKK